MNSFGHIEARFRLIGSYVRTPRDLHKLMNSAAARYPAVEGEVCRLDFIMLETIRVFEPEMYAYLRANQNLDRDQIPKDLHVRDSDAADSIMRTLFWDTTSARRRERRFESRFSELRFRPVYLRLSHDPGQVTNAFVAGLLASIEENGTFRDTAIRQWGDGGPSTEELTDLFRRLADFIPWTPCGGERTFMADAFGLSALGAGEKDAYRRRAMLSAAAALVLLVMGRRLGAARYSPERLASELVSVMRENRGIELATWFVQLIRRETIFDDEDADYDKELAEALTQTASAVFPAAKACFEAAAEDGRMISSGHLSEILPVWQSVAGSGEPRAWARLVTESDDRALLTFVDRFQQGKVFAPALKQLIDFDRACQRIQRIAREPARYSPGGVYTRIAERFCQLHSEDL